VLTRQEKKRRRKRLKKGRWEVKAFFCSGVKACFHQTPGKKLLQVTGNF